jgi:hypothetical protein
VTVHSCRQRLTWPTSAPFRVREPPVSGRLSETTTWRGRLSPRFPGAFQRSGLGFLGHPVPAEEFRLPHGRPTEHSCEFGPRRGFHVPLARDASGLGAPFAPGRWCSPGRSLLSGRHLPILTASPAPQRILPSPGFDITRHHRGFTHVRPSGLPLTCNLRMERRSSDLNPELRTPPLPATHVKAGTSHRALARDYTTDISRPPICESTRLKRHRVARRGCRRRPAVGNGCG